MRRPSGLAAFVFALCVAALGAPAIAAPPGKGEVHRSKVPGEPHSVDIGAITFAVEAPHHTQYVVTKISVGFMDEADAEHYAQPRHVVRLRDVALSVVNDTRPGYGGSDADLDALKTKLHLVLTRQVPSLHHVDVALLGSRNVPRK